MSHTKHLVDLVKVCSILPVFAVVPAMADGYLVQNEISLNGPDTLRTGVSNVDTSTTKFNGLNSLYYITTGVVEVESDVAYKNNKMEVGVFSTSSNQSELVLNPGVLFEGNIARFDGGAVANFGVLNADGVTFTKNKAQTDLENNTTPMGGGALALGSVSKTIVKNSVFTENKSGYHGGAIAMRAVSDGDNSDADLDIYNSEFVGNVAEQNGGAIYSTFYDSSENPESVSIIGSKFVGNSAQKGGAIWNEGAPDKVGNIANMKIEGAYFEENIASEAGAAVYNLGTLEIKDSEIVGNKSVGGNGDGGAIYTAGDLTLINTDFRNNSIEKNAADGFGYGGAIFAQSGTLNIQGKYDDYAEFVGNNGFVAGAIYVSKSVTDTTIKNVRFENNTADEIGALGLFGKSSLKNVEFYNNKSTSTDSMSDGGGALFLGAVSSVDVDGVLSDSLFDGNESATRAGAVSTRTFYLGNNKDAYLDIKNTQFKNNIAATNGGAIDNFFYHSATNADAVYVTGATFEKNSAANGGAIYNHGSVSAQNANDTDLIQTASIELNNVSFTGNTATEQGGAIFNETDAKVFLSGTNTFTGNTADGLANDIHNLGTLNIVSGTTTIDGGISGNTGVLNISSGATLNMGTSAIVQDTINIDGTVNASALSAIDFARLYGDVTGSGVINLNVATTGTYKLFNKTSENDVVVNILDKAYNVTNNGKDGVVVSLKTIEELTEDVNITTQTAGVVTALAESASKNIQQISLAAQELLNSGDIETLEAEAAKLNPEDQTVAQSVATSIAGQTMSLAANRMSGAMTMAGRSGGDAQLNGVWAQGLYNKSKSADKFDGRTYGIAFGADTLIDDIYTIGVGFAYNTTDVSSGTRETDIDSNTLFLYGQYKPSKWFANATLAYTMSEYTEDTDPFGAFVESIYDVDTFGAQLATGYDFATGLTPSVGLRYLHIAQEEYSNGVNTIAAHDTDFLTGVAELKYAFVIESDDTLKIRPELRAAMTYDFISDDSDITVVIPSVGSSYSISGENLSEFGAEFGVGLTAIYNGVEVSATYDLDLHEDYTSHSGMIKFRGQF